VHAS